MKIRSSLLLALLATAGIALSASAQAGVDVDVRVNGVSVEIGQPPPTIRLESEPILRPGYVWAPGFWRWDGHHHVWVGGTWMPARAGHAWVPERWEPDGHHWRFTPGHWQPVAYARPGDRRDAHQDYRRDHDRYDHYDHRDSDERHDHWH